MIKLNSFVHLFSYILYFLCGGLLFGIQASESSFTNDWELSTHQSSKSSNSYTYSSSDCSPITPTDFCGEVRKNEFVTQTDIVHVLSWKASPDGEIAGYRIFQGNHLIKELAAHQVKTSIHNRSKSKNYTYRLVAFNTCGKESKPLSITLGKKKKDCDQCIKFKVVNPNVNVASTGNFFSQKFTTHACLLNPKFTTESQLPAGLILASDGTLSGIPTELGNFSIIVTVKDANGCTQHSRVYRLTIVCGTITFTTTNVNPTCNGGSNGSITFTTSGGTPPLAYSINGGATFQSSNIFTGLAAGTYPLVVKDANNCIASGTATLTASTINFSTVDVNPTCNGGSNGSITFTASGGTSPLVYSINGGATFQPSNVFTGVAAGTYSLVVRDVNNCTASGTTTLTEPNAITFTTVDVNPSCNGGSNGSITFTASGGRPPLVYSINGGATFQSSNVFTGVAAGTYSLVVKDVTNCTTSGMTTLTEPDAINFTTETVDPTFPNFNNGSITINASGGTGTLVYSINGGASFQTSNVFNGLIAGTYNIVVMDQAVTTIDGSLTSSDPVQTGRLARNGTISTCAAPKPMTPDILGGSFRYDAYTFTNTNNTDVCVNVEYSADCGGQAFVVAYLNSFNSSNVGTNYLADPGSSNPPSNFSFNVPAGSDYVLVVSETEQFIGCPNYTLTVIMPTPNSCTATGTVTLERATN